MHMLAYLFTGEMSERVGKYMMGFSLLKKELFILFRRSSTYFSTSLRIRGSLELG